MGKRHETNSFERYQRAKSGSYFFNNLFQSSQITLLEITDEFVAGTALHIMSLQSISELESCDILLADVGIAKNSEQVLLVSIVA